MVIKKNERTKREENERSEKALVFQETQTSSEQLSKNQRRNWRTRSAQEEDTLTKKKQEVGSDKTRCEAFSSSFSTREEVSAFDTASYTGFLYWLHHQIESLSDGKPKVTLRGSTERQEEHQILPSMILQFSSVLLSIYRQCYYAREVFASNVIRLFKYEVEYLQTTVRLHIRSFNSHQLSFPCSSWLFHDIWSSGIFALLVLCKECLFKSILNDRGILMLPMLRWCLLWSLLTASLSLSLSLVMSVDLSFSSSLSCFSWFLCCHHLFIRLFISASFCFLCLLWKEKARKITQKSEPFKFSCQLNMFAACQALDSMWRRTSLSKSLTSSWRTSLFELLLLVVA